MPYPSGIPPVGSNENEIEIEVIEKGTSMLQMTRRRLTLTAIALSAFVILPAAGQVINEDLKLTASDGAMLDRFGYSVAADNGVVAVGAPHVHYRDISGSAYLFDISTGVQIAKLLPNDSEANDLFGYSIDINNGIIAVGAPRAHYGGSTGSAYLFDASTGIEIAKLLPNDSTANNQFGYSIAIDNGIVAVGAPRDDDIDTNSGSVYLFDASTGIQIAKILPNDGEFEDLFGNSIAIDNGVIAVGAWGDDDNDWWSGSAYLFDVATGAQLFKLLPSDGVIAGYFGFTIDIDNGIVAVGAPYIEDAGAIGSAYLFDAITGMEIVKILPDDSTVNDQFGFSIAINNGIVAIGAVANDDNGSASGSAYFFDASTGDQIAKFLPTDGSAGHAFGSSIAIDNGIVAVGARGDDPNGTNSGSAYLFTTPTPTPCPADLTNDGILNFFDVSAFITALTKNDPIADFTNDGRWNFFDVSAFLQAFAAGCP